MPLKKKDSGIVNHSKFKRRETFIGRNYEFSYELIQKMMRIDALTLMDMNQILRLTSNIYNL